MFKVYLHISSSKKKKNFEKLHKTENVIYRIFLISKIFQELHKQRNTSRN